ncbi:precorrin-6A reductase [Lysinibacillus telephonicus]|uniref:Precorrin-6A reductase n=1 Tax=Lysinibacillus telephonicus TaxID=1714840 RepID=A0A431UX98_9BACI|nr:precorrin-6A reductase [Lysinibacillus telephonicus]RTQ96264.1 precorrin-6A reductase [Lysinibacillus telephonicus]
MILFLAGTSDARALAVLLQSKGYSLLATVVTQSAADSLAEENIPHHIGRLTAEEMQALCVKNNCSCILDASHPFAEEASKQAMAAAQALNIPYIRFERKQEHYQHSLITEVASYQQAAQLALQKSGTIMLTTGSKTLKTFTDVLNGQEGIRVIARMLPNTENMEKCQELGIAQKDIVAIQGPFTKELNTALYKQYGVTVMVTKESGKVGSVDEKIEAALECGIEIVLIKRPQIKYGQQYETFEEVEEALKQLGGI